MPKLTKAQRAIVHAKYDGHCAYCGEALGKSWHADHLAPVERKLAYVRGKGLVCTGEMYKPENDNLENMMPACPPCNIDKHSMSLENWRIKLSGALAVLARNNPTYRHARRFGLLRETPSPIVFHFERMDWENRPLVTCAANRDGDCSHKDCPRSHDGEPAKSGRHCPWILKMKNKGKSLKALPVKLIYAQGYEPCPISECTHVTLDIPGPTGSLTLPVILKGTRDGTNCWTWNGDVEAPTLRPSVRTEGYSKDGPFLCHSWINDGHAQFLGDCSHELRGKTVPLNDI